MAQADNLKFEIEREIGVISEGRGGWNKKLTLVSWFDEPAKYDIRDWDSEHIRMGRGMTFTAEEARALYELLRKEFEKVLE